MKYARVERYTPSKIRHRQKKETARLARRLAKQDPENAPRKLPTKGWSS